ncbi:hypothetical protein [Halovenus sp. HT40]|uniref:hypothetical protein n=1 Tax=Halovenus sp. HT40 TaxID=3126691 RepID=UPI00300E6F17
MPECTRCGDFTDVSSTGEYHYCEGCQEEFQEVEKSGIIVEDDTDGDVHVIVTAHDEEFDGGTENSQVDGIARGKYIAEETDLPAMFKYRKTGSMWMLDEYLEAHPDIRKRVHQRLSRVPDKSEDGLLDRVRAFLNR